MIRNTADEEDGKEEPDQDTEQLPEDGSADSDEEEGDEQLDQRLMMKDHKLQVNRLSPELSPIIHRRIAIG